MGPNQLEESDGVLQSLLTMSGDSASVSNSMSNLLKELVKLSQALARITR